MKYIKFPLPKGLEDLKPKKIIDLSSIDEIYIGFEKPKKKEKK